jgi:anti-sigma B factor antagonist
MEVGLNKLEGIMILTLKGRSDASNTSKMEAICEKLIASQEKNILIDCTQLEYISSAGLRILLKMAKQVKKDFGKIVVAHMNEHVRQIFQISGFIELFPAYDSVVEGLNCFHPKK